MRFSKHRSLLLLVLIPTLALFVPTARAQETQWEALNKQLAELYKNGRYQQALPVAQESLKVAESTFGPNHFNVASSANNLAEIYRMLGRYDDAKPLYQRTMKIVEGSVGPDNTLMAAAEDNLGELERGHGNPSAAEPLFFHASARAAWTRAFRIRT